MGLWSLLQLMVDVALLLGVGIFWYRFKRPADEDPRLSRGLQLLQSKIAVLEDLSDRTDHQVKTLSHLLDQKSIALQGQMLASEHQVRKIEETIEKNKVTMEDFPLNERVLLERDDTAKYVQAAKLAHSGASIENMQREVELPREQLELISKMNKQQLMYDQTQLPSWVSKASRRNNFIEKDKTFEKQKPIEREESKLFSSAQNIAQKLVDSAAQMLEADSHGNNVDPMKDRHFFPVEPEAKMQTQTTTKVTPAGQSEPKEIKKFVFPRI